MEARNSHVPLLNVGLGAAKNVAGLWSFPLDNIIHSINALAQQTLTPADLTNDHGMLSIKSTLFGDVILLWKNQQAVTIDYVLPATVQKEPLQLRVPITYITVASMLVYLQVKLNALGLGIPPLRLNLTYYDIGNHIHETSYGIHFNVLAAGEDHFTAFLEPKPQTAKAGRL